MARHLRAAPAEALPANTESSRNTESCQGWCRPQQPRRATRRRTSKINYSRVALLSALGLTLGFATGSARPALATWVDTQTLPAQTVVSGQLDLDLAADLNFAVQGSNGIWIAVPESNIHNALQPGSKLRAAATFAANQMGDDLLSSLTIQKSAPTVLAGLENSYADLPPLSTALYVGAFSAHAEFPITALSTDLSTAQLLAQDIHIVYTLLFEWQLPADFTSGNNEFLEHMNLTIPQFTISLQQRIT